MLGSVLWTIGLLIIAHLLAIELLHRGGRRALVLTRAEFHAAAAGVLTFAFGSMAVGVVLVSRGMGGLERLRGQLSDVRDGRAERLGSGYPSEVQPLADDLDALLAHREEVVRRALTKAGDLAHGLKTPLAILSQEAERATRAGQTELATSVGNQVERMRRQIDYHLAHARAAASGATLGAGCRVLDSVEGLTRTLQRLHAERGITIELDIHKDHTFRGERQDLDEMIGNLLDNACKWAKSRVGVSSVGEEDGVRITVDDDGAGLDPSMRDLVLHRGVRADEASPGSGLGLAIVRDIAELYGGSISLSSSPAGGLRATLHLPS